MSDPPPKKPFRLRSKTVVILSAVVATGLGWWFVGERLSRDVLEFLAHGEEEIVAYHTVHPVVVLALAYALYTLVTGASLPGAAVMTLLFGWFFQRVYGDWLGLLVGVAVVNLASTSGATLAFLLSRYLLRDFVRRAFGSRLDQINRALEAEGAFYLFTLRLVPVVPFFVINVVMGLTPIRTRTFWWVSQVGMLPGTVVYVLAGTRLPGPRQILDHGVSGILSWDLILAFAVLGIFPLAVRRILAWARPAVLKDVTDTADKTP